MESIESKGVYPKHSQASRSDESYSMLPDSKFMSILTRGVAIPACPLALTASRKLDERRQRALVRYYAAAGVGGLAVAVHTTQFAIRDPAVGLFEPVLALAAEELKRADRDRSEPLIRIGGICGKTVQAVREASILRELGYHVGLLSLAAMKDQSIDAMIDHARAVAEVMPIMGFYLQPSVGGCVLPFAFWRKFVEIENLAAVKIAPFNRYQTIDVIRALVEGGRDDVAVYTGNDDNIVADLTTPYRFQHRGRHVKRRIVGGLLGHWSVWTRRAVELLQRCKDASAQSSIPFSLLAINISVTDANAAFFDAANAFAGCIAGLHYVLKRQRLLEGIWCLDPHEQLSPGQQAEIERVYAAYPELNDDDFVAEHRDQWLR
jgi:Dihydrodipicolinate synthetase family